MSYRPEWWDRFAKQRSILEIALDLKMARSGASDADPAKYMEDLMLVEWAADNWKSSSHEHDQPFDRAVKQVLMEALAYPNRTSIGR